jgi:NAD(P)-dependent dehydrogenase (short-subunit alcohol dehydrogenase family)
MKSLYWNNKKILITGGTSGLGRALAHQLIEVGARVATLARHRPNEIVGHFIAGDVSDKTQIHRIYAEATGYLGGLDLMVNNASTLGPTPLRLLADTDCEDLESVLQTNLVGPFRLSKLALSTMILQNSGVIVNISSDAAVSAYPGWGAYSASKAALDHLTRIFQAELSETKVRFLALDPGDMDTPLHMAAIPDANRETLHRPEDSARLILQQIELAQFLPIRRRLR